MTPRKPLHGFLGKHRGGMMPLKSRNFEVGEIQCVALNDGTFNYPTDWLFSNVAQGEIENTLRAHDLPPNQVESPYTCLLVRTRKHLVLIDTGADGLAPTTGDLAKRPEAEGVRPEDVTHVLITHGHPDHIGGALDDGGKPLSRTLNM